MTIGQDDCNRGHGGVKQGRRVSRSHVTELQGRSRACQHVELEQGRSQVRRESGSSGPEGLSKHKEVFVSAGPRGFIHYRQESQSKAI